jgi:pantoate--beta-alanine ligase
MQEFSKIEPLRNFLSTCRQEGKKIALVPTMGYLHDGHLSLIKIARNAANIVITSIFVNPKQFNNQEDLINYPQNLERDLDLLKRHNVDGVFIPEASEIYNPNFESHVFVENLSKNFEGAFRPGHFQGVSTVVAILFNIIQPHFAVFGEKDFQQLRIIEKMVSDLQFNIKILRAPIVREPDGLAMSSRNVRLSTNERNVAVLLNKALFAAKDCYLDGEKNPKVLCDFAKASLNSVKEIRLEYLELVEPNDLSVAKEAHPSTRLIIAAWVGNVRLIDNLEL